MMSNPSLISVVVPCYNERENIPVVIFELKKVLNNYRYELIIIDDGSTDGSHEVYSQMAKNINELGYVQFSRNFGHQAALKAGIDVSSGDAVVTIDADLQQPPRLILEMINK